MSDESEMVDRVIRGTQKDWAKSPKTAPRKEHLALNSIIGRLVSFGMLPTDTALQEVEAWKKKNGNILQPPNKDMVKARARQAIERARKRYH